MSIWDLLVRRQVTSTRRRGEVHHAKTHHFGAHDRTALVRQEGGMTKLRVHCFSVSLDGFGAGPQQDRDNPLGVRGLALHRWLFATQTSTSSGGAKGTASEIGRAHV